MPLSKELVGRLQTLLSKKRGVAVSEEEAFEIGTNLVNYFDLLDKINRRATNEHGSKPP